MAGKKCRRCYHRRSITSHAGSGKDSCCNYIIDTGKRRPCEADDNCTVFKEKVNKFR